MKLTGPVITLVLALSLLGGCKQVLKQPENVDQIYVSLREKQKSAEDKVKSLEASLEKAKEDWDAAVPQTGQVPLKRAAYFRARDKLRKALQKEEYYRLHAESRQIFARKSYFKALKAGKPWPDKKEVKRYREFEALREASRNWGDRVPKLQDRIDRFWAPYKAAQAARAPAGEGKAPEGGGHE